MIGECKYVNPQITEFYLTKWNSSIVPIYSDNNVINHYEWPGEWYQIKIDTATMTYSQEMSTNNQNGIFYNEIININIPKAENSKWLDLIDLLYAEKYIIVFKDNNGNWFTAGYRWGTEVKTYQLAENQYIISFISPHANNLPTLINDNFVINNIINLPSPSVTPSITPSISRTPTPTPSCVSAFILEIIFPTGMATDTSITVRTICTAIGGPPILVRQIFYSKTNNPPTNADTVIDLPLVYGTIDTVITGLEPNTGYYFCTYAANSCGDDALCFPNLYYTLAGPTPSISVSPSRTPSRTPSISPTPSITPSTSGCAPVNPYATNLQACWDFNEVSGTFEDSTVNNHDLDPQGSVIYQAVGKVDSYSVGMVNPYARLTGDTGLTETVFSVSTWFKTSGTSSNTRIIMTKHPDGYGGWSIGVTTLGLITFGTSTGGNSSATSITGITVNDGQWHHYVVTYDNGSKIATRYLDGVSYGTGNLIYAFSNTNPCAITLGNIDSTWSYIYDWPFYGWLDATAFWDRELTLCEVLSLWNNGNGLACGVSPVSPTPSISVSRTPTPTHTPPSSPSPTPLPAGFGIHTSHTYTSSSTCCSDAYSPQATVYLVYPHTLPVIGDFFYTDIACTIGFMGSDKYYYVRRNADRWAIKISASGTGYIQDVVVCF
jgi:hypothetical protein